VLEYGEEDSGLQIYLNKCNIVPYPLY